jgi:hypothetical protein
LLASHVLCVVAHSRRSCSAVEVDSGHGLRWSLPGPIEQSSAARGHGALSECVASSLVYGTRCPCRQDRTGSCTLALSSRVRCRNHGFQVHWSKYFCCLVHSYIGGRRSEHQ